ncbi:MAG: hypothetical protein HYU87_08815, partial [Chloroflexi bacterium]|nr:hypothetical protein [Chloroflexota bacterium]
TWTIPDPTLRSLLAAECDQATALAVGRGGSILTIDDELRRVRVDRFGADDLSALARFSSGAVAVGAAGTVAQQGDLGWRLLETGVTEDLLGIAFKDPRPLVTFPLAWIVGAGGASYRLVETGWERVATGTTATLRDVVLDSGGALAVGDRGTILRYLDVDRGWKPIASGTEVALQALAIVGGSTAWIVGEKGTVIEVAGEAVRRVDLGTACTLRAVFTQGSAVWVVGSDGVRGGAWRVAPTGTERWGSC